MAVVASFMGNYGEGIKLSSSTQQQSIHPNHVKLLGEAEVVQVKQLAKGLDLTTDDGQQELFERVRKSKLLKAIRKHPELIEAIKQCPEPEGYEVSAADVTIEFLVVVAGMTVGAIDPGLKCNCEVNERRRLHLAREAHERLKKARVREEAVA